MNKYLGIYSTSGDVQTAINNGELNKPYVAIVSGNLDYNTVENQPDYSQIPLTFEILSDGNISWTTIFEDTTIEYSLNGGAWTSITSSNSGGGDDSSSSSSSSGSGSGGGGVVGTLIPVVSGDTVQFRGTDHLNGNASFISTTAQFNVYGNLNSLITTAYTTTDLIQPNHQDFNGLFCLGIGDSYVGVPVISAENLVILGGSSYIDGCSKMFRNCTSLITGPQLLADNLQSQSCVEMFDGCTNLNYVKCLATQFGNECTEGWLTNVSPTGTFVKKAGTSYAEYGIPSGWTVVEE